MDVARHQENLRFRVLCLSCRQPMATCYCNHIQKFDPRIKFVILIHHLEARRRIATGRMAHLCLKKSHLIRGHNYSEDIQVNLLLENKDYFPVILYPGLRSINLTKIPLEQRRNLFPQNKKLMVFVIDGTWHTARKMVRLSENLKNLPQICFSPPGPSAFRVRIQPKLECYSTIEAIHQTIELVGPTQGFDTSARIHDGLLGVFNAMVEQQLEFVRQSNPRHFR